MRLCDIESKPIRVLSFAITIPIALGVFFAFLVIYSLCHSVKCACLGFVDYYNDKNVLITYKSLKGMCKNAWHGKSKK